MLSTDTWIATTGGNWDTPANWSLGTVPTASEDAVIDMTSIQTVTVSSVGDEVASLTTNSDTNFVDRGSLAVGADSSIFGGPTTVDSNSTLTFGAGASVQISSAETFSANGTLNLTAGDVVTLEAGAALAVGGTLTAASTTFTGNSNTSITVSSGGVISASVTNFGMKQLILNSGSNDALHFDTFNGQISINNGATINIAGNDFSNVGSGGVIAAGSSTATINLPENYWGSTNTTQIETLIDDHHVTSSLPTISFEPIWATNSGTIATPETVYFSPFNLTFDLSATVSTTGGLPITGGTETFIILNGSQQVGATTAAASVEDGSVAASYTLPGETAIGAYTIEAEYSGYGGYPASTDTSEILTVSEAPASQIAITSTPLSLVAGTRGAVTLQLEDPYGDTGATSSVPQTISLGSTSEARAFYLATSGGSPITTVTIPAGQSSITFYYFDTIAGNPTVTATDSVLGSSSTQLESVVPAGASKVEISSAPLTLSAGGRGPVRLALEDQFNNSGATSTIAQTFNLSTTSSHGAFFAVESGGTAITSIVITAGQSGIDVYYGDTQAGTPTVAAFDLALSSTANQVETIVPGHATHAAITSSPLEEIAGSLAPLTVQLEDEYNNTNATSPNDQTVDLSTTSAGGAFYASASGGTPINSMIIPAGQSSITAYYEDTIAGDPTLTAADVGLGPASTQTEVVSPASVDKMAITSDPLSFVVGNGGEVTVTLEDQYGNPATSTTAQTVSLSTTSDLGGFYTSASETTPITGAVIPANAKSATFFYGDAIVGTPTITAADTALDFTAQQQETVSSAGVATMVVITSPALTLGAGNSGAVTVELEDQNGDTGATSATNQTIDLGTTSAGGVFYATQSSSTSITSVVIGAGESSATFYYDDTTAGTPTVTAADSGLGSPSSQEETVTAAAANHVVFNSGPLTLAAGSRGQVTVEFEDQYNNPEAASTTDQTINLTTTSGNSAFYETSVSTTAITSIIIPSGQSSATFYYDDTRSGTPTLTTSDIAFNSAPTQVETIVAGVAKSLEITGYPSTTTAGVSHPFTVTVLDAYGNVDAGYTGTVQFSSSDGQVADGSGLPLDYTFTTGSGGDDGVHTFTVTLKTAATQSIKVSDTSVPALTASQTGIAVTAAAATQVKIVAKPTSGVIAGVEFALTVDAEDPYNNLDMSYGGQVTLALTSGSGSLMGMTSMNAARGVAAFTDLIDTTTGPITIGASSGNLTSDSAGGVTVNPAPADHFVVTTDFADPDVAGSIGTVAVTAEDQYDNIAGSGPNQYLGTVNLASTDPLAAGLPTSYMFTAGGAGSHIFANMVLETAGSQTISATDSANHATNGTSPAVGVVPAAIEDFAVTTSFASPDVAGTVGTVTVTAKDAYGNSLDSGPNQYLGTVDLSGTDDQAAGLPATHAFVVGDAGSFTFNGVALKSAGTQTITATDSVDGAITGDIKINVVAAAAHNLVITTSFASTDVAGTLGTVTISAFDAYNNLVSSGPNVYAGTVDLGDTDDLATGLPPSHTFTEGDAGSHTFSNVVLKTAGSQSITATDTVSSALTDTAAQNVVPAAVKDFVVTTSFANLDVAGTVGSVTVTAEDPYGNIVGSGPNQYRGTVDLTSTDDQAAGVPASHTFTSTDAGTYTVTDAVLKTAGHETITATGSSSSTISGSAMVTVSAAAGTDLVVTTPPPNPIVAGQAFTMVVSDEDAYHNVDTSFNGDVTISLAGDAGLTTTVLARNGVATFGGLSITTVGQVGSIEATSGTLSAGTTGPITVTASSSGGSGTTAPMIESDQVATTQKLKKGKKVGKAIFSGFRFQFNMPINISAATLGVYSTTTKRVKKKTVTTEKAVSFTPSYDPSTNTVFLTLKTTTPFAKSGGEITISGVTSQAGTLQSPSEAEFVITKNAKGITEE